MYARARHCHITLRHSEISEIKLLDRVYAIVPILSYRGGHAMSLVQTWTQISSPYNTFWCGSLNLPHWNWPPCNLCHEPFLHQWTITISKVLGLWWGWRPPSSINVLYKQSGYSSHQFSQTGAIILLLLYTKRKEKVTCTSSVSAVLSENRLIDPYSRLNLMSSANLQALPEIKCKPVKKLLWLIGGRWWVARFLRPLVSGYLLKATPTAVIYRQFSNPLMGSYWYTSPQLSISKEPTISITGAHGIDNSTTSTSLQLFLGNSTKRKSAYQRF